MDRQIQILLLATSETNKLDPLTQSMPAPMVPLANRPVMSYSIEMLNRQGYKDIFVSLYHLANQIEAFFRTGQRWGVSLEYILQQRPWGTAGSLKWADGLLKETFVVLPADAIVDVDINKSLQTHFSNQTIATVVVSNHGSITSRALTLDPQDFIMAARDDQEAATVYQDTGVYIFEPEVLKMIPGHKKFDIHDQLLPRLLDAGEKIGTYQTAGYWNPLDSFQAYQAGQRMHFSSSIGGAQDTSDQQSSILQHSPFEGTEIAKGIWIGRNTVIHPNALFAPPVVIGNHSRIGRNVEIGPEVVIGSNVVIDNGASIRESTIIDNTYVGKLVNIEQRLVNKDLIVNTSTGESTRITDDFLLGTIHQIDLSGGFKRSFDVALSLILLIGLFPLFLILGILVLLTSGRIFQTVKCYNDFRDPANFYNLIRFYTRKPDGKLTLLGGVFEAAELHRLPEFFNVLKGDMSLVGVKPLTQDEAAQIREDWQRTRFDCPTGFTGLWYIGTDQNPSLDEVFVADSYYAATRTWREDIKLMRQTVRTWLRRLIDKLFPKEVS